LSQSSVAFKSGERIARLSVLTLLALGVAEIGVGTWTRSLSLRADGVTSILDAFISLIVWLGLHYSRRRPDARFHFGYHKVESFGALISSLAMIGIAAYILYESYLTFLNPRELLFPHVALATIFVAGVISLYRAFQMRSIATKYGLLSLRTDANNSIKDATASFVACGSVLGASFGLRELDAVGGMIIAIYILGVAYVAIRESSLILMDAFENPEMAHALATALKTVEGIKTVSSLRLRPSGPFVVGVISVTVDGSLTVARTEQMRKQLLDIVVTIVERVGEITIVFRSDGERVGL
jgi:cation diffusion facilitator family transporter